MYHVSLKAFDRHLEIIESQGLRVLGPADLTETSQAEARAAHRDSVAICFDDGWMGPFAHAAERLSARGWPSFCFVTTDFIGRKGFVDRRTLRTMGSGLMWVGSHARSHRMLSDLETREIRGELADSRAFLEDLLGREVRMVSIPGGAVDSRVRRIAVEEVGYTHVFTSSISINPTAAGAHDIARVGVTAKTTEAELRRWLSFRLGPERIRKAVLDVPKKLLGMRRYSNVRRRLLGRSGSEDHLFDP